MTFGTTDEVEKHTRKVIEMGKRCPGYIIACADTIPANVPLKNIYKYFETVEKERRR